MRFACILPTRTLWRRKRKHHPPGQPESVGIGSGKQVQLDHAVQDQQQQEPHQDQVQQQSNQNARETEREICDLEGTHNTEVTSTDSGTTNALDPEVIEHTNNADSEAGTGAGTPQLSPTGSAEVAVALEDSPRVEAAASIPEEPMKEVRASSRVMELIREREASCKARPSERKEFSATLSPGLAALRQRKKVDISAWDKPSRTNPSVGNMLLPRGNAPADQVFGKPSMMKDLENSGRFEPVEGPRAGHSQRMETPEPSSPTTGVALDGRQGPRSVWGGDTSSPSVSSVDGATSPDSEHLSEGSTHRNQDSKPIKLVWSPQVEDDPPRAGKEAVPTKDVSLKWERNGGLVNSGKVDLLAKAMVRGPVNGGANAIPIVRHEEPAPTVRKNRGPKGGPFDEEEILKWVQEVTGMDIDPECGVHYSLKDGVALCRLMAALRPEIAIPEPSDSATAYKQMANICTFLQACRSLGIPESILFEAADLQDEKDIPKVVVALVTLGEMVQHKCPAFDGPKLNVSIFSWTPAASGKRNSQGHGATSSRNRAPDKSREVPTAAVQEPDSEDELDPELTDDVISNVFRSALKSPSDRGLNSRQFASLWRSLSGGKENFFHETKMFNKFNVAEDGTITLEEFVAGIRDLERQGAPEHDEVFYNLFELGDS